jgi:hypothetical protein
MAFRICDLMITTIRPLEDERVSLEDMLRGGGGYHDAESGIPLGIPAAPPPSRPASELFDAPPPRGPDNENVDALDIVELRALLQLALSRLGGPVTEAELKPQAIEDLDQLETRLAGALQEVRDLKKSFGAA